MFSFDPFDECRVKYLDQEDIESLGFNYGNEYSKNQINGEVVELQRLLGYHHKYKINIIDEYNRNTIFDGYIKNKLELVKVLKMIGYDI